MNERAVFTLKQVQCLQEDATLKMFVVRLTEGAAKLTWHPDRARRPDLFHMQSDEADYGRRNSLQFK